MAPASKAALRAGRLMLEEIERRILAKSSFAFETTLSGKSYAQDIPRWQRSGYQVKLVFLRLPQVEDALIRVAMRVHQGGHHVPDAVIRRRFSAGWRNFESLYRQLVDIWMVYDNSGPVPKLLEQGEKP